MPNDNFERAFSLLGLDENFDIISPIAYSSLQWSRKYSECGSFSIVVQGSYFSEWKYVYSPTRREVGIISQINLSIKNGVTEITISGLFLESELDNMMVYPKPTSFYDQSGTHYSDSLLMNEGSPTWISQSDTADVVALAFFNGFKKIAFTNYEIGGDTLVQKSFELDIKEGSVESGEYKIAKYNRTMGKLGSTIYKILKPSYASYTVNLDFVNKTKSFNIIHARDLSGEVQDLNINPVVLSTVNGTLSEVNLVQSDTSTKDVVISASDVDEESVVLVNALPNAIGRVTDVSISQTRSDYWDSETPAAQIPAKDLQYKRAVMWDASSELQDKKDILNMTFKAIDGSYQYMVDFDLGDIVAIEVPEIGLSINAQIIACYESVNNGVWKLEMEFGTPLKIRK